MASNFSRVVPLLERAGHDAIAVDLPGDDPRAGLPEYRDIVVRAIGTRQHVVLVALSLGGFTAPMVCERARPERLVFLNAMIPEPNETPGAWWKHTHQAEARIAAAKRGGYTTDFDVATYFLHDIPPDVLGAMPPPRDEAANVFEDRCEFAKWPDLPIKVVAGRDDRFFPLEFQERIAKARLGLPVHAIPGGHLASVSHPEALAAELMRG